MAYRNNNLQTAGEECTPKELKSIVSYITEVFQAPTPDLHNPQEVENAIIAYFNNCERHALRPGNLGLYSSLGLSKQDVNNAITGKSKSKVSPECIDLLKKAMRAMSTYREQLAMTGKINPVTYIFMGKNFDSLSDVQQIEVSANTDNQARLSPEQIAKQIEQDIPIDSTYKDITEEQ